MVIDHNMKTTEEEEIDLQSLTTPNENLPVSKLIEKIEEVKISNDGEFWIGSRSCRYQGYADIAIYGDRTFHQPDEHVGYKYYMLVGLLVQIPFALGEILLGIKAYVINEWHNLQTLAFLPMLMFYS